MTAHEITLYREVSIPAFFEKLAGAGVTPPDHVSGQRLLNLGDVIVPAVHAFIEKQANQERQVTAASIKSAVDATFAVAGMAGNPAPTGAQAADFLRAPQIAAAAAAYRADLIKQAAEGGPTMPGAGLLGDDDDEEKKKKEMAAVGASAAC